MPCRPSGWSDRTPTEILQAPVPEPDAGEALLRVGAAGACHSDLHVIDSPNALGMPLPLTLGHKIAGWIHSLGAGVTGHKVGDAVAVYGIIGCGVCSSCLAGRENECRNTPPGGIGLPYDRLRRGELRGRAVLVP